MTEPGAFLILLIVSLACTGTGLYQFVRNLVRIRAVRDTPRSKVRSAAQGYVELHGRAEPSEAGALTSDLARRSCVWYRFTVEKRQRGGKTEWSTIDSHQSDSPFGIADETGHCIVDPAGATVSSVCRDQWHGNGRRPDRSPSERPRWWQHLLGFSYRYTEEYILPGDPIYVIGDLRTTQRGEHDGDDAAELNEEGRDQISRTTSGQDETAAWRSSAVTTVARPADTSRVFLIAAEGENELLRLQRMKTAAAAALFLFGILATAAIVMVMRVELCIDC